MISESNCVTITVPRSTVNDLSDALTVRGYFVKAFGLHGRYHSPALASGFQTLLNFCELNTELQLPSSEELRMPLRSPVNGEKITGSRVHEIALQSILTHVFNWDTTITAAATEFAGNGNSSVIMASATSSIPKALASDLNLQITNLSNSKSGTQSPQSSIGDLDINTPEEGSEPRYPPNAIAVIGMAGKFPGADSLDAFWELIESGGSMTEEVPESRFSTKNLRRTTKANTRFWGNFLQDVDSFDHRFFKKSAREAVQMDPQQRLLLEVAYQALESSGYFNKTMDGENDIGCYVGLCASDYNDNVASHPPTAYSSLGTLRAFLSGKISHYFGWSGPSVTFDTACSSSAVAIDAACKSIILGDCSQAVAGGVNVFTSANFYQNLMAASFLSPTGATKSFDSRADGYCRGEGVGLVVLKKLSAALADGDNILGVISATAVNQNNNAVPITVPYSDSQVALYERVTRLAEINPTEITYVEAHGTGTPVGDPIETDSIRRVFGGPHREQKLYLGSIKANIGHTEGTSGVAGLIKVLLMMQHRKIPVQANFVSLNPKIHPLAQDKMEIPLASQTWNANFMAACVNNYGAAGSNAAMVVCQGPISTVPEISEVLDETAISIDIAGKGSLKYPVYLSAHTVSSLSSYLQKLLDYIAKVEANFNEQKLLGSLAFTLQKTQNRSHPHAFATTVSSLEDLRAQIRRALSESNPYQLIASTRRPLILAFGGQVSNVISLPVEIYKSSSRLRFHLDQCDTVLQQLGHPSIFPDIFLPDPVKNVISLHSMLFSVQYSFAKTWMDCGLKVDGIIGHSFGQLTALSVCGSLSLKQGLELVAGRAALMQAHWGEERGSMISIEADSETISKIVQSINARENGTAVEVACYNGPTSHVLVGSENSIKAVEAYLSAEKSLGVRKWKVLNVPYGFHSQFTEPILPGLLKLAKSLKYKEPTIPIEMCSEGESWREITAQLVTEHSRVPVYFGEAVQRITNRLGPCSWLEAGMNSSIGNMARRALDDPTGHAFYTVNLSPTNSLDSLAKITLDLQKDAYKVQYWPFQDIQRGAYEFLQLPPYQFEKTRHWIDWIDYAQPVVVEKPAPVPTIATPPSFMTEIERTKSGAQFLFNPQYDEYQLFVKGHRVLNNPLCPAPLYLELVAKGVKAMEKNTTDAYLLGMENLEIKAPLGLASNRLLTLKIGKGDGSTWEFEFSSRPVTQKEGRSNGVTSHASGTVTIQKPTEALRSEFIRYERLIGYDRTQKLATEPSATTMQGSPVIYKVFEKVVHYDPFYKGVQRIAANGNEVVGLVTLPPSNSTILKDTAYHPLMVDNFIQVSGLHVNALSECGDGEVYVCTKLDRIQPTPAFEGINPETDSWTVYSSFTRSGERDVINDIFVFDTKTKNLVVYVLGARFTKVAMNSLARVLSNANTQDTPSSTQVVAEKISHSTQVIAEKISTSTPALQPKATTLSRIQQASTELPDSTELFRDIKVMLSKVVEVDVGEINLSTTPDELGIDSLMVNEVLGDIQKTFGVDIPLDDFVAMEDVNALFQYLRSRVKGYSGSDEVPETRPQSSGVSEDAFSDVEDAVSSATSASIGDDTAGNEYQALSDLVNKSLERDEGMTDAVVLADAGMDSLLCMEVVGDIEKEFGIHIDPTQITNDTTFGEFFEMVFPGKNPTSTKPHSISTKSAKTTSATGQSSIANVQDVFHQISRDYDIYANESGFAGFWNNVYPAQARLVLAYVVEAMDALGINLKSLSAGSKLAKINTLPRHDLLVSQLYNILQDGSLVQIRDDGIFRTNKPVDPTPAATLLNQILEDFPQHASEHKLLSITGSKLADCLTGAEDALMLLFRPPANRRLLEDVYQNGPMYAAVTKQLGTYFSQAFDAPASGQIFEILELGGGTGGTTKYLVEYLARLKIPFRYTFTDVSASLVNAMQRKMGGRDYMSFGVVDIEKQPEQKHLNKYHAILSTNCIHATRDLTVSGRNIRSMLREDGFIALVEFTRNMFWFDLVFGLLDGWWSFTDGRTHVLADEFFWERSLRTAGFKHVTWTGADTEESNTLRIITAFQKEAHSREAARGPHITEETVLFKQVGPTSLFADIYYPSTVMQTITARPIGTVP